MKKILFCLPVALISAGLLVSCGAENAESAEATTTEETPIEENHEHDHDHMEEAEVEAPTTVVYEEVDYLVYGPNREFDVTVVKSVDDMYMAAMESGETEMVVSGSCTEVCQQAGCWIEVARENGDPVFVKFKDHFTLPIETTSGRDVVFHGIAKIDTTSVEMQKHFLDDRAKAGETVSQEEYDAITEPKIGVMFIADGIMVAEPTTE